MPDRPIVLDQATPRLLQRAALGLFALALLGASGCAALRARESAQLAKASEPFQATPATPTASLLVVGDSTAVGTGASGPARSLPGLMAAAQPGLRVVNRGADGARYRDFIAQLQASDERFDTVLVLGGGNDVIRLTGEQALRTHARRVAELAAQRGARVIFMPPGNVGNAPFFFPPLSWVMTQRSQVLHAAVREAASGSGAQYVRLYKPRAEDPFAQQPELLHARDGLHPSDAGYRLWLAELSSQAGAQVRTASMGL